MKSFSFSAELAQPMDEAIETLKAALMKQHLGIVSDVNVAGIIKTKLDEDIPAYRILGVCNPKMAKEMIEDIPQAGALLPCTIVAREQDGKTVFECMDPEVVLGVAENAVMNRVAMQAKEKLQAAVAELDVS